MRNLFAIAVFVSVSILAADDVAWATADYSPPDAACRRAMGKGVQKLSKTILKEQIKCHKQRMGALIPDTVNCNDLQDPNFPGGGLKIAKAQVKLEKYIQKSCVAGGGTTNPQDLGYTFCPEGVVTESCDGVLTNTYLDPDPVNPPDVGLSNCFACLTKALTADVIVQAYGTPPVLPSKQASTCQSVVGKSILKYFTTRMKEQQACQYVEDLLDPPTSNDCRSADPRAKVAASLQKLLSFIGDKCADTMVLAELDSCGTDVTGEQQCVQEFVEGRVDEIFNYMYKQGADGVFVSSAIGTPTGAGTFDAPASTLNRGLALAVTRGLPRIYVDGIGPAYSETSPLQLRANKQILGGYNSAANWLRDDTPTFLVSSNTTAIYGSNADNAVIDRLRISSTPPTAPGSSSYGIRLYNSSSNVTVRNCEITAGNGTNGSNGGNGSAGAVGGNAGAGNAGDCDGSGGGSGGSPGGSPCGRSGGVGGQGGYATSGGAGGSGTSGGTPGGGGSTDGNNGGGGGTPSAGSNGSNGAAGGFGTFASALFTPASAADGADGSNGNGGGGGGGGGGQSCGSFCCEGRGGGGGGGGGGGCLGTGGDGGIGGGGSFGIVVEGAGTTLNVSNTTITTGTGGSGGSGGLGMPGGSGGAGAAGAGVYTSGCSISSGGCGGDEDGTGGPGGNGTKGGDGGHGGGGRGGPSVGIYCANSGAAAISGTMVYNLGSGGSGGLSSGNAGSVGTSVDTNCM